MPQNAFFPPRNHDLLVSQKKTQRHLFSTLHPLCPVIFATAKVLAFVLLRSSRFNFQVYTQLEATPTQKSARKWRWDLCHFLRERLQKAFTRANQLHWTTQWPVEYRYPHSSQNVMDLHNILDNYVRPCKMLNSFKKVHIHTPTKMLWTYI